VRHGGSGAPANLAGMSAFVGSNRALPTGNVTFLFTDIEGSTRLWERAAGAMRRALVRHDDILRRVTARNNGVVFKTVGDSFYCVFAGADDALRAAIEAQHAFADEPWPKATGELGVRIALHTGNALLRHGDYFGPTVNRVANLAAAAHARQILLSSTTASRISKSFRGGRLHDLGAHRLKDLDEPETIFQAIVPGLSSELKTPSLLDAQPNNLPSQISSFVGRTKELSRLRKLVAQHRIVTIAGFGGIGKTRLALQFATDLLADSKDGCWFVSLKEKNDPAQIAQAAADALRLRHSAEESIEETLLEYLYKKQLLLVIDNAEHLVEGVAAFARRVLETAADVRIVVTSREPLHITGEQILRIGPIEEGDRLFIDRVVSLLPDIELQGEESLATVHSICRKLQGIPLAIELAAVRVGALSLAQLDEALTSRLRLPGDIEPTDDDNPLAAMLEWSYRLLKPAERRFLCQLSIFEGPFTIEAASAVAKADAGPKAIALAMSLTDKSLVALGTDDEVPRYSLLDVVREFAALRLRESGEVTPLRARYCGYYLALIQEIVATVESRDQRVSSFGREWSNLQASLRLALEEGFDVEGGRLAVRSLWEFWVDAGRTTDGWYFINRALEGNDIPRSQRTELLQRAAQLASKRGDFAALDPLARILVETFEHAHDPNGLGTALQSLANARLRLGNGAEAEALQRRAIEQFRLAENRLGVAAALANLGTIAEQLHLNYDTARTLLTHSLAIARELQAPTTCAEILGNLAVTCERAGDHAQALLYARESLALFQATDSSVGAAMQYINLAEILIELHKPAEAAVELQLARKTFGEQPKRAYFAYYFEAAFKLAMERRSLERAARIYGFAERYRQITKTQLLPSERASIDVRRALLSKEMHPPRVERLIREGAEMNLADVEGVIDRLESAPHRSAPLGDLR
jgi:predicted ATPase/class 3 adenylate cyclase